MTVLLENECILITLKKNVLYHQFYNKMPDKDDLTNIAEVIQNFYNICEENNKKFYHIYNFNNISIFSLPNFTSNMDIIKTFFLKNYKIFEKYLYCSCMIIQNSFVRNCIKMVLNLYTPTKPISFVENDECAYVFFNKIKEEYKNNKWTFNETTQDDPVKCIKDVYYNEDDPYDININDNIINEDEKKVLEQKLKK